MASEVSLTRHDGYLFVHLEGDPVTGEERLSLFAKMLTEAADGNLDLVIHEDTPGGQPLTAEQYITRANFLGTSEFKNRIAYVPPPGFPPETCELIENAAWNHGRRVRAFFDVEDAILWIESHADDTA